MPQAGNVFSAFGSGINEWLPFEFVNRAVAAGAAAMGHGTYHENMKRLEAQDEANRQAHPYVYGAGALGGAVGGGAGLVRGVGAAGNVLSRLPSAAGKVGDALVALTTLRKGQTAANIAKLATGGAAYGGTDETLRGGSPGQVAAAAGVGAATAPLAVGALKAAGYLGRPLVDLIANKNYGQILRRITTASADDLQKSRADYVAKTGAEPTLFELLPKGDRDKIGSMVIRNSPSLQDQTATAIRSRAQNVEPEMRASVEKATAPDTQATQDQLATDLAGSRGVNTPTPQDIATAAAATKSKVGIERLRSQTAANIMAPHDNKTAYASVDDMLPQTPQTPQIGPKGSIQFVNADPEVSNLIRSKAGILRLSDNITISQVQKIREALVKTADRGGTDSDAAHRAINHIDDLLQQDHPDAAAAMQQMRDTYAAHSRMLEGAGEGAQTRPPEVAANTLDQHDYGKTYETPEGTTGRAIGQTNELLNNFSGTPEQAIASTSGIANDTGAQNALASNLGPNAAGQITDAAKAQSEGLDRISAILSKTKGDSTTGDAHALSDAFLLLNPHSFAMTKAAAWSRLGAMSRIGEAKASYLVDRLFSQDPVKIEEGLKLFDRMGGKGRELLRTLGSSIPVTGAHAGAYSVSPVNPDQEQAPPENGPSDITKMSDEDLQKIAGQQPEAPDISTMSDEDLQKIAGQQPDAQPSPYAGQVEKSYSPEFQQLFDKMLHQESGHQQMDAQGNPVQSPVGAVGIAQVMPTTAPKAAKLAGLPWDEHAYYTDPEYNKALGAAYLDSLLQMFKGNPALAVAAYNAGPGRVKKAIVKGQSKWAEFLPSETKDYLQAILQ